MKQQILKFRLISVCITLLILIIVNFSLAAGNIENGKKKYNRNCMECHHTDGMGILAPPFVKSTRFKSMEGVVALIDYIMPAQSADLCTGTHAEDAAEYIVNEFKFQIPDKMIDPESITDKAGRKVLFDQKCSVCHGADGKGDLARSVADSTLFKTRKAAVKFIDTLMPFHNPGKCKGTCAENAALHIIENFNLKISAN